MKLKLIILSVGLSLMSICVNVQGTKGTKIPKLTFGLKRTGSELGREERQIEEIKKIFDKAIDIEIDFELNTFIDSETKAEMEHEEERSKTLRKYSPEQLKNFEHFVEISQSVPFERMLDTCEDYKRICLSEYAKSPSKTNEVAHEIMMSSKNLVYENVFKKNIEDLDPKYGEMLKAIQSNENHAWNFLCYVNQEDIEEADALDEWADRYIVDDQKMIEKMKEKMAELVKAMADGKISKKKENPKDTSSKNIFYVKIEDRPKAKKAIERKYIKEFTKAGKKIIDGMKDSSFIEYDVDSKLLMDARDLIRNDIAERKIGLEKFFSEISSIPIVAQIKVEVANILQIKYSYRNKIRIGNCIDNYYTKARLGPLVIQSE